MSYTPINVDIYVAAYAGALAGIAVSGKIISDPSSADYMVPAAQAGAFAQAFDIAWGDNAFTSLTIELTFEACEGTWDRRSPPTNDPKYLLPATYTALCTAIVAVIQAGTSYFSNQGITPPNWNSGGGGGSTIPNPPGVGFLLTSTGTSANDWDWELPGGFQITAFAKNHGATFEVGASDVSPVFTASYNETPDSAEIIYTGASGSPLILTTPFTGGTIAHTFTSSTNGTSFSFELSATKGATTRTSTLTDTWGLGFLSVIAATGSVAATQAFLDTMRTANGAQIHTSIGGTYLNGQSVGAGQVSAIATPTALGTPTFRDKNNLVVSPVLVNVVSGYTNPNSVVVSMNLYTVGGVGIGTVSWSLS